MLKYIEFVKEHTKTNGAVLLIKGICFSGKIS